MSYLTSCRATYNLGSLEILEIHQNWVEIKPSTQSCFLKWDVCNSTQKLHRSSYQTFLFLFNFAWLFHFVPNILSMIVGQYQLPYTKLLCDPILTVVISCTSKFLIIYSQKNLNLLNSTLALTGWIRGASREKTYQKLGFEVSFGWTLI